ncbi:hypothetical protein PAJL_117 [Cutibacterium acnes HL042PA3]|nr:hypothetical protein PAJL_117 [Cutibacterium acnes HL042PA3]MCW5113437.1 hypothetical protein [Cutibacterium acnes P05]
MTHPEVLVLSVLLDTVCILWGVENYVHRECARMRGRIV